MLQDEKNIAFFRQIPYILNWKHRDVTNLVYKFDRMREY